MPVLLFSAAPMFRDAGDGLRQRRIGMDLPVSIGIVITFVASTGATFAPDGPFGAEPYFDSLTMFVAFLLGGRYLALKARHRVAASLEAALARLPAAARRLAATARSSGWRCIGWRRATGSASWPAKPFPPTARSRTRPRSTRPSSPASRAGRQAAGRRSDRRQLQSLPAR